MKASTVLHNADDLEQLANDEFEYISVGLDEIDDFLATYTAGVLQGRNWADGKLTIKRERSEYVIEWSAF